MSVIPLPISIDRQNPTELIALGTLALLYLFGIGWSLRQAAKYPRGRFYWLGCAALIVAGTLSIVLVQPDLRAPGRLSAGFLAGVLVVMLGVTGTAAGCAWQAIGRLRRES